MKFYKLMLMNNEDTSKMLAPADEKWLMTPLENSENFRHVKNNCPDDKRGEVKFLEFDEK